MVLADGFDGLRSAAYVELDEFFDDLERPDRRPVIYTVALLAGLTLAAIAWRVYGD